MNTARIFFLPFTLLACFVFAIVPSDLRETDPISNALYHTEHFQDEQAIVPNTPQEARQKITDLIQSQPENAYLYKALSDVEVELLDFAQAETHIKQFVDKSQDKDSAYYTLEDFYHQRLRFKDEYLAILNHAAALKEAPNDPDNNKGPYLHYNRALLHLKNHKLPEDPETIYKTITDRYPQSKKALLDWIQWRSTNTTNAKALELVELFQQKFPNEKTTYILKKAQLLKPSEAFELMNSSYDPLWEIELSKELDQAAVRAEKKGEYLTSLKEKLEKNPLDLDSTTRLFHSYHFAGNPVESTAVLNDFRLLKEKSVREKKSQWEVDELWVMARLHQRALNLNEAARFYFALYGAQQQHLKSERYAVTGDEALFGLFEVLLTAEERPVQIAAGNLDFYKDIATTDSSPGVFNGILSLILNGTNPKAEFITQEEKAIGYFNRAQAAALLRLVDRNYPSSKHLPGMYRQILKIYLKYGMDDLIIQTGEDFFKRFPNSNELLDVGLEVVDAYARKKDNEKEWSTYEYLLKVASQRSANQLFAPPAQSTQEDDEDYGSEPAAQPVSLTDYESLLKRYIASLTREKNYMGVLKLYRDQIQQHPTEETLYQNFADYLAQNKLFDDEFGVYKQAIQQFKTRSWYEKLARWYIRQEQANEFEKISQEIIDLFSGTEVAQYINSVQYPNPTRSLQLGLNKYALSRFPFNLNFVHNLLFFYSTPNAENWPEWEALSRKYYFLDEKIRNGYLYRAAYNDSLENVDKASTNPEKLYAADLLVWKSHFAESVPVYQKVAAKYPSDRWLNVRLADLKRSLGWQNPSLYEESARLREHLAQITPSDVSLWTNAGETAADIENYETAKKYWENIVHSDPHNPERYLEVATILWDYYLFDDALVLIERARKIEDQDWLYAYEAGAIYESKRNYEAAVAEYSKSLYAQSENASSRLSELYKRPRLTALIRTQLDKQLNKYPQDTSWWLGVIDFYAGQQEKNTVQQYLTRAIETLEPKSFAQASTSLMNSARKFGFHSIMTMLIQKEIQYATSDLQKITLNIELAKFYESRGEKQAAETILVGLYNKQPASSGLIQDLIQFYWRNENYDKAFAVYDSALSIANSNFRKRYLREVADRYRERKMYHRALATINELRKDDPLNTDLFKFVSEIYAEQNHYKALSEHYRAGLQLVKDSKLSEDQKKEQIAAMRRGIIQANLILKDYTAALDQYIELLNRDAENEELVREAAEFGARYQLTPRLIDYYQKTAVGSPKDHRWPMMLARIYLYSGNPAAAITNFQAAIAIRPERVDLNQSLADAYRRAGLYKETLQTYERLYELTYKDTNWLAQMAELEARSGNQKKALQLYEQYLSSSSALDRNFQMAQKSFSWGMNRSAIAYGNAGMKEFRADITQWIPSEGFNAYIEAQVQTGSASQALEIMHRTLKELTLAREKATFDDQQLASTQYMLQDTLIRSLPIMIRKNLTGVEIEKLETALLTHASTVKRQEKIDRFLPLARASGMARAEERLLVELVNESYQKDLTSYRSDRDQLRRFYLDRHAFAACGNFLEAEYKRAKPRTGGGAYDIVEVANAYRLAQMPDKELAALREYYANPPEEGTLQPETVERYLTLLYERNLRDELKEAAEASPDFTPVNFFVKRKDRELAQIAIDSISEGDPPVWRTTQSAMLGKELNINEPIVRELFITALDLRPIGELLATKADEENALSGDEWFYYGVHYGEYLWNIGNKFEAPAYLVSDVEGAPVRDQYQDQLGLYYLQANMPEQALQHFTLAAELKPSNVYYQDHRAEALVNLSKKEEAISIWKGLIAEPSGDRYLLVLKAASKHGFVDSIQADLESFLNTQIEKNGALQIALITKYLQTAPDEKRQVLITKWIPTAPAPKEFADALLRIQDLKPADRMIVFKQTASYLKTWMRSAEGQELELARNQWIAWNLKAAIEYLESGQIINAESTSTEVLEEVQSRSQDQNQYTDQSILLHAKILVRKGKNSEAVELLRTFARESLSGQETETQSVNEEKYRKGVDLLQEEGRNTEASILLEEMYDRQLTSGATDPSIYIGLAEIRLEQNKFEEALQLFNRMIYGAPENPESFNLAATSLEKYSRLVDAIQFRTELSKRKPWDLSNSAVLAEDYLALMKKKEAIIEAKRILENDRAAVEEKVRAAKIFGSTSTLLAGPLEMQEIEKFVRKQKVTAQNIYDSALRQVLIERNEQPPLKLVLSELYVNPTYNAVKVPLFHAYKNAGLCEQALLAIDPENLSHGNYEETYEYSRRGEYYSEYDQYDPTENYPVNNLNLSEEESLQLALEASDCAAKIDNSQRQIFFLRLALDHESNPQKKEEIKQKIAQTEQRIAEIGSAEAKRWKVGPYLGRNDEE
jgi:tetratricopeptide (TPR) repeat protein